MAAEVKAAMTTEERICQFVGRLRELSESEWTTIAAREREARATFGPVDLTEIEAILRVGERFDDLEAQLGLAHPLLQHSNASVAAERFGLATDGIMGIFAAGDLPWAWTHGLLAAFIPIAIPEAWLGPSEVPYSELPTLPECRLPFRLAALTGPQWDDCVRIANYTQAACGEDQLEAVRDKAHDYWMAQQQDRVAELRQEALNRTLHVLDGGPFAEQREVLKMMLKRMRIGDADVSSSRAQTEAWAKTLAADAVFAVIALEVLSTQEFSQLYLPITAVIPFPSLFPPEAGG